MIAKFEEIANNTSLMQTSLTSGTEQYGAERRKDLSIFSNDYFDFCYSIATIQHFPKKSILHDYMKEISRVLKNGAWFRLHIDDKERRLSKTNTWYGEHISLSDIQKFSKESGFKIINTEGEGKKDYWFSLKCIG